MSKDCLRYQIIDRTMILKQVLGLATAPYQFSVDLLTGLYDEHSIKQQISCLMTHSFAVERGSVVWNSLLLHMWELRW